MSIDDCLPRAERARFAFREPQAGAVSPSGKAPIRAEYLAPCDFTTAMHGDLRHNWSDNLETVPLQYHETKTTDGHAARDCLLSKQTIRGTKAVHETTMTVLMLCGPNRTLFVVNCERGSANPVHTENTVGIAAQGPAALVALGLRNPILNMSMSISRVFLLRHNGAH